MKDYLNFLTFSVFFFHFQFIEFPSTWINVNLLAVICLARDGLPVIVDVAFKYRLNEENVLPVILKYSNYKAWAGVVRVSALSAIHHSCSNFGISEFQKKRGVIQQDMEDNVRLKLEGNPNITHSEGVYAEVVTLELKNLDIPTEYETAVQEKQSKQEDIGLAKTERIQATTKADTELQVAEEEAKKIKDTAENEADVLLTEADRAVKEILFAFEKEAETLADVKSSWNLSAAGIVSYVQSELLSKVEGLTITSGEPAKLSRSDEL